MIFDLDPDPGVTWKEVIKGAQLLKILLEELELKSFVKTTGGKGLHVVLPLSGKQNWKEVKEFSKSVVEIIVKDDPDHYTSNPLKVKRKGKIFLDYLRNERGATAVAPYSTRARAQAPVSAPLFWAELDPKLKSDHFNVKNILRRINGLKKDPWEGFFKIRQSIKISAKQKLERG